MITGSPVTLTDNDSSATVTVTNPLTRDLGNFKITKSVSNPDGATLPAAFTGTYDCGTGYTGNFSVAAGASQTISGIPTGNVCSVVETAPVPITGYTWGPITYTPTSIEISTKGGTFEIVVGNSITRDLGNFKITKSVSNPDGATLPAAFTGTYDCGDRVHRQLQRRRGRLADDQRHPDRECLLRRRDRPGSDHRLHLGPDHLHPDLDRDLDQGRDLRDRRRQLDHP